MKDLIDKLSSYNIFNYLFPGIIFAVIGTRVSSFHFLLDDIVVGVFVYYLYGMVISRIGSLLIERLLKRVKLLHFASYADFVTASRVDTKIDILSEQNNTYRTLASVFLCILLLIGFDTIHMFIPNISTYGLLAGLLFLLWLFVCAYIKQTDYISKRVTVAKSDPPR